MKNSLFIYFIIIFSPFIFFLINPIDLSAQVPQYYNYSGSSGSLNSFPFNVSGGKAVNSLFLPGAFNQPTPVPPGNQITKVYFYFGSGGTRTYSNFHILMAQSTITDLTYGSFYSGTYDTVYFNSSLTLNGSSNSWTGITLNQPYVYDPTKSLIIFVGQCGATGSGFSVRNVSVSGIKRVWSIAGCPFSPYSGGDASTATFGFDVIPAQPPTPDLLYFKFEDKPIYTATPNCANPGVGFNPAGYNDVSINSGGQFDSCLTSTGTADAGVYTGWFCNLGSSSWTVSIWIQISSSSSSTANYFFGDQGGSSFRGFHHGIAGRDSMYIRATGMNDISIPGIGPSPTVVSVVYDSAIHTAFVYKNGSLVKTVNQPQLNLLTGTGFKVGGYHTSNSFIGKMDEFRLYKLALSPSEVAYLWNKDIPCGIVTGITGNIEIPENYILYQNYPNPFNPVTKISYDLSKSGFVTLRIFDLLGKEISVLINEFKPAGKYSYYFDASTLASGVYFYRIDVNGFSDVRKMMLIR